MGQITTITIPDPGASSCDVILSKGDQSMLGALTVHNSIFASGGALGSDTAVNGPVVNFQRTSNQAIFSSDSATPTTLTVPTAAQITTITLPDPGTATASIVLTESAQTIPGAKTFTGTTAVTGLLTASGGLRAFGSGSQLSIGANATDRAIISASGFLGARTISIPDIVTNSTFVLTTRGTVTQSTSLTTAVTLHEISGVITTATATTADDSYEEFKFTNARIVTGCLVLLTLQNYSGTLETNGVPVLSVQSVASGSCTIRVANVHTANSLNGVLQIGYLVV